MNFRVNAYNQGQGTVVSLRCPACKRQGTFDPLTNVFDLNIQNMSPPAIAGLRRCPNAKRLCFSSTRQGKSLFRIRQS